MNLLFNALRIAIDEACKGRGLDRYRLDHRFNAKGELVLAVITSDPRLAADKLGVTPVRKDDKPRRD